MQEGYYSATGTMWNKEEATLLDGGQEYSDINLTLLPGKTISGTVSFPPEKADQWGRHVTITAEDLTNQVPGTYSDLNINSNGAPISIPYTLNVPDTTTAFWRIKVEYPDNEGIIPKVYYTAHGTSPIEQEATLLQGGQDYSDINIPLLLKEMGEKNFQTMPSIFHLLLSKPQENDM